MTEGKEGMSVGTPIRATDADSDVLNYVLSGEDSGKFKIDQETGQITVGDDGLDYEAVGGTAAQCTIANSCSVMVNATDSAGEVADTAVTVSITITDLNEKPTFITAGVDDMEADHAEGNTAIDRDPATDDVQDATYRATDPEGGSVTLSLMGDDKDMFMLTATPAADDGNASILSFKAKPDFEMPGDRNKDNIYEVTVRASDGVMYADRMVTVKVTDADEVGKVELSSQDALIEVELTTTLTDSDGGVPTPGRFTDVKWQWHRLDMANQELDVSDDDTNNAIEDETSASYTPTADDRGKYLKVTATYTDRTRDEDNNADDDDFVPFMNTATSDATTAVRNNPDNQAPKFKEGASTFRVVAENTMALMGISDDDAGTDNPADNVGGPIEATDADDDTPTYALSGADAAMFRVRTNGQIEVSDEAMLNYESKNTYMVTLTATDSSGESNDNAAITVTIHVINVDEAPVIMVGSLGLAISGMSRIDYAENGMGAVETYTASGPDAASATWSLSGDDAG